MDFMSFMRMLGIDNPNDPSNQQQQRPNSNFTGPMPSNAMEGQRPSPKFMGPMPQGDGTTPAIQASDPTNNPMAKQFLAQALMNKPSQSISPMATQNQSDQMLPPEGMSGAAGGLATPQPQQAMAQPFQSQLLRSRFRSPFNG